MFHKEGSCTDVISSSNNGGSKSKSKGKGKGRQQTENPTIVSKAVDVPLRKSDRRKLRQRVAAYFSGVSSSTCSEIESVRGGVADANISGEDGDDANEKSAKTDPLEVLLDEIFLKGGTISSRSLPRPLSKVSHTNSSESKTKGNHENIVLYVKSPSPPGSENNGIFWPYIKKTQFAWIALEDKKSGAVLHETPSVALLAVIWHAIIFKDPEQAQAVSLQSNFERNRIVTVPSPVSRYLCRGADLMRAGILFAPQPNPDTTNLSEEIKGGNKKKNQKKNNKSIADGGNNMVFICAKGNPQPFAVGRSILWTDDQSGNNKPYGYDTKGVGVEVWNCFGDDLWRTTLAAGGGTKTGNTMDNDLMNIENGSYGNPGFCDIENELFVVPLQREGDDDEEEEDLEREMELSKETASGDAVSNETKKAVDNDIESRDATTSVAEDESSISPETTATEPTHGNDTKTNETDTASAQAPEIVSSPSPDEILHATVCQALVNLRKNDLPMLVGTFYTKHVVPNKPKSIESADLLKETSYKKFGNYLKKWQVNDAHDFGLVQTGPDPSNRNNKDPNALLVSFNRRHEDLQGMRKTKPSGGPGASDGNSKIALVKLYVVPQNWTNLLRLNQEDTSASNASSEARRGTGMLTLPEVKKLLDGYLERESSLMITKSMVALDGPLTDALYGKKSNDIAPEQLSRKDLSKRFVNKLSPAYCIVQMPGSHVLKLGRGTPPKVEIEVVQRQSRKFVTRVRGLEEYLGGNSIMEPAEFCKDVSKRLAISGSIDTDPAASGRAALPKKGCVEYVFGANIVDELEALLTGDESLSDHGGTKGHWAYPRIPGSVIDVTLRKGVPARRKRRAGGR